MVVIKHTSLQVGSNLALNVIKKFENCRGGGGGGGRGYAERVYRARLRLYS